MDTEIEVGKDTVEFGCLPPIRGPEQVRPLRCLYQEARLQLRPIKGGTSMTCTLDDFARNGDGNVIETTPVKEGEPLECEKFEDLHHGDCLEVMKDIESGSVDMVLTDPPYGTTAPKWDNVIDFNLLWVELNRVIKKDGIVAMTSSQPFTTELIKSNQNKFKYVWYWIKNQGTNFFHAKRMPIRKVEEVCIFGTPKSLYNPQHTDGHILTNSAKGCSNGKAYHGTNTRDYEGGKTTRFPTNILEFDCVNNYERVHSSQKPVALMEYLIKTYTNEGETVLDFTMGSGTTGVACKNLNRNFIGIELDENYFNIACRRICAFKKNVRKRNSNGYRN